MSVWITLGVLLYGILLAVSKGRVRNIVLFVFCWGVAACLSVEAWHEYAKWAACTSLHDVAVLKPGFARQVWIDGFDTVAFLMLPIIFVWNDRRKTRRVSGAGQGVEKPL